jgi:hypothetical protein
MPYGLLDGLYLSVSLVTFAICSANAANRLTHPYFSKYSQCCHDLSRHDAKYYTRETNATVAAVLNIRIDLSVSVDYQLLAV